jgi:hypothetical protein
MFLLIILLYFQAITKENTFNQALKDERVFLKRQGVLREGNGFCHRWLFEQKSLVFQDRKYILL